MNHLVFVSERGAPFTTAGFSRVVEWTGAEAKLGFKAHPHMLRHACGFKLANDGHDTRALQAYLVVKILRLSGMNQTLGTLASAQNPALGHKNIQHTVRYTELSPTRFKDFWRD
jgi:hypothetical protein